MLPKVPCFSGFLAALAVLTDTARAQEPTKTLNAQECTSAYYSIYAHSPPTAPPALDSWAALARSTITETWTTTYTRDDPGLTVSAFCSDLVALPKPSPPSSVSDAWNSYSSALSEWRDRIAPDASSIASACSEAETFVAQNVLMMIATDYEGCTSAMNIGRPDAATSSISTTRGPAATVTTIAGPKQNDNGVGQAATPATSSSTAAAVAWAMETRGCVAAAAAAAAAVGVVGVIGVF